MGRSSLNMCESSSSSACTVPFIQLDVRCLLFVVVDEVAFTASADELVFELLEVEDARHAFLKNSTASELRKMFAGLMSKCMNPCS